MLSSISIDSHLCVERNESLQKCLVTIRPGITSCFDSREGGQGVENGRQNSGQDGGLYRRNVKFFESGGVN